MEKALDQVRELATGSEDDRHKAIADLQNLAFSLESPQDTIHRYGHMVSFTVILAHDGD
jgi:hypothetical protein